MDGHHTDIAIAGGGLAGGLIALALAERRPDVRVTVVESGDRLGGNHIWSSFASDVEPGSAWLLDPLVSVRWPGYAVHFPAHSRELNTPYLSIASERLDARLRAVLPAERLMTGARVTSLSPHAITLSDGRTLGAGAVIDARGPVAMPHLRGGWQKFLGRMFRLEQPHGLTRPEIMDARVEQVDGYRFVYCLPFSEREIFVEDTYYSSDATLDVDALRDRIGAYVARRGWVVSATEREETGVLPVIADGDFAAFWAAGENGVARAGARAALVHPVTSYSLPDAVRFAEHIAALDNLSGPALAEASHRWARAHWREGAFYRRLVKMLFGAAAPRERYKLLERFYTLPEPLIERFYAGKSSFADELRTLSGKPPVPIGKALASLAGHGRPLASLEQPA